MPDLYRRSLLIGLALSLLPPLALGAPDRGPVDPVAALSPPPPQALAERLRSFAQAVAQHRWDALDAYFDPEHRAFQHKLWFSPEYNEHPDDPADPRAQAAFRERYLIEVLGLGMVDNHVKRLDEIEELRYLAIEEPFGAEGPLKMRMEVRGRGGRTLSGWFFIDRSTWLFSGAAG